VETGGAATVDNVTCTKSSYGIYGLSGTTLSIRNTISVANSPSDFDSDGTVSVFSNNMYDTKAGTADWAAVETGTQSPPATKEDLLVSVETSPYDLHLESSGHTAIDNALDLSASFSGDIDGEARSAPWDIGADERYGTGDVVNYRSIGSNTGVLYSGGNASIDVGSSRVIFSGANLPSNIGAGDKVTIGSQTFYIASRDSASQVTLQGTAGLIDHTRQTYTIERAYNSFEAWEAARQGDLVGENRSEVGIAYNDGALAPSAEVAISGSTTDADHYMTITVAEGQRHTGIAGTGVVVDGSGVTDDVFQVQDEYTVIEWLEIKNHSGGTADAIVVDDALPGTGTILRNLIIHGYDTGDNAIRVQSDATIRNTFIYDGLDGIRVESGAAATLENVTIYGMVDDGVNAPATAGSMTVRNVISVGNGGDDFELASTIGYFGSNMYSSTLSFDPASYQGSNQSPPASLDDLFF
jgi:hypothetical protein